MRSGPTLFFLLLFLPPVVGSGLSFTVGGYKPGQTIKIDRPLEVRLRASVEDPLGIKRLEILANDGRVLLSAQCPTARKELSLFGEYVLNRACVLRARSLNVKGEYTNSAPIEATPASGLPSGRTGPLSAYPLGDITTPRAGFRVYFRLEAKTQWNGTVFATPGGGYRIRPREFPFVARRGDGVTMKFELILPPKGPFPARVPLSIAGADAEAWRGSVLISPWEIVRFKPVGRPVLFRRGKRIGLAADDLVLETVKPARKVVKLILDCFSEGWEGTKVRVNIAQPIPRVPVTLDRTLPERRSWEAVAFELDGIPLAVGNTITVNAESKGKVLVGGVRVMEK